MVPEDLLLYLALLATAAAWANVVRHLWGGRVSLAKVPRQLLVATASLFAAMAVLLVYFLTVNLSIDYVFTYTSTSTPWFYRIAGLWGGQKGTILIWASFSALYLTYNDRAWRKKIDRGHVSDPEALRLVLAWILAVGLGVLLAFEGLLIVGGTFARTDAYLLHVKPHGVGLQPVLRTPFMIIHPPLQFMGYAFSTLLFSCGIAAIVTKKREWADVALPWTRLAFVVGLTGLGLGGLWAYYVLNFGGYWAWDPVETANLLAWFPLLLLVHALLYYRKRQMYATAAPLFAVLTLTADLFSTVATRTGLWISVHAFTDPSRTFARDPLQRLLNILDTSLILQWLSAMLFAAIAVALVAYVKRMHDDALQTPRSSRVMVAACRVAIGVLCASVVLAFLDVHFLYSALFQVSDAIGFGNANLGLAALGFGVALVFAAPGLTSGDDARPAEKKSFWDRYINTAQLVFLGVVFISLAFLVTFLLQILSVNGFERSIYDERAPIVALPVLMILPAGLAHNFLGPKRVVALSLGAGVLGIVLALAVPAHWHVLLVLPALAWALVGCSIKLFKVSDRGVVTARRLRVAGGLQLFGGVATMVYWANPPSFIELGVVGFHPVAALAPVGILVGLGAALSSIGIFRTKTLKAHRLGALFLALGWTLGLGPLLAVAVLALVEPVRGSFPDATAPVPLRACAASVKREIRKTGVYLMHVGIVIGLAGIAFSTYEFRAEKEISMGVGGSASAQGYNFTFVDSAGHDKDPETGLYQDVTAYVDVRKDGKLLGRAPLIMWQALERRYAERIDIERYTTEDVYLRPVEFVTPERTFLAQEENVALTSGHVDQVTFTVKTLPAMHLVWGGLWIIVSGMLVNLAAGAWTFEVARPKPSPD